MGNVEIRFHFKRRVKERYGINLSKRDMKNIMKMIGPKTFVRGRSNSRKVHRVDYKGKELLVVYDTNRKVLVTALTNEQGGIL